MLGNFSTKPPFLYYWSAKTPNFFNVCKKNLQNFLSNIKNPKKYLHNARSPTNYSLLHPKKNFCLRFSLSKDFVMPRTKKSSLFLSRLQFRIVVDVIRNFFGFANNAKPPARSAKKCFYFKVRLHEREKIAFVSFAIIICSTRCKHLLISILLSNEIFNFESKLTSKTLFTDIRSTTRNTRRSSQKSREESTSFPTVFLPRLAASSELCCVVILTNESPAKTCCSTHG